MKVEKIFRKGLPELKLSATMLRPEAYQPKLIKSSRDAYELLQTEFDADTINLQEECMMLVMNRRNEVMALYRMSKGGTTGTVIDAKLLFTTVLMAGGHAFIVAHNHPSGSLRPSDADIMITKKLYQGGKLLELQMMDHLILTDQGYFSMGDNDMLH